MNLTSVESMALLCISLNSSCDLADVSTIELDTHPDKSASNIVDTIKSEFSTKFAGEPSRLHFQFGFRPGRICRRGVLTQNTRKHSFFELSVSLASIRVGNGGD